VDDQVASETPLCPAHLTGADQAAGPTGSPFGSPKRPPVTLNDIGRRAYQKWVAAGRPEGNCVPFWWAAEQELLQGG
jgi:Protein of unknown function (DUF2934)